MGAGVSNIQKTGNENVDKTVRRLAVLGALRSSGNENKVVQVPTESNRSHRMYMSSSRARRDPERSLLLLWIKGRHEMIRRTSALPENFNQCMEDEKKQQQLYDVPTQEEDDFITNFCAICKSPTILRIDGWPCRVCGVVYHRNCLQTSSKYTSKDLDMFDRTKTAIGWSCEKCDNILNLLQQEELDKLSSAFEEFDINRDSSVSVDEYLAYKRRRWFQEEGYHMPPEEEEFERTQFRLLDADGNGDIDYWEFAKKEACKCLANMPKEQLVALLSPLEKLAARRVYDLLDDDQNGFITEDEARVAFTMWYSFLDETPQKTKIAHHGTAAGMMLKPKATAISEQRGTQQASLMLDADEDGDRTLTWREFLKTQALYILCARSNKTHLR
ncbi:hypothetical protein LSH36_251g03123 [Paralvinella palmiformis]|uniref:EF-hand domain-containing protein n=1 Tax=Paralvinella palmiformis TaxID=53620 RepID=A0AAD9N2R7_9ANNE|nr:hypothetical protein LSH36_251g03123 [Paralvinella palmiformis]